MIDTARSPEAAHHDVTETPGHPGGDGLVKPDYDDRLANSDLAPPPYPLIRTAVPGWDNDPRRQGAGMVVHGATPELYQAWLERLIAAAEEQPVGGQAIVCINAWNEWGEGAYLEPDVHFGAAFLNATGRAVAIRAIRQARTRLLLVGHDAFPVGMCTRTVLAKADVVLWRRAEDWFRLECWRSFAPYVTDFLRQAAEDCDA